MTYNAKYLQIYLFFCFTIALFSCKQDHRPDVSEIKIALKIQRFDRDLYAGKGRDLHETNELLQKKYGNFYADFTSKIIGSPNLTSIAILDGLYQDQAYTDLNKEVDSIYPNLNQTEKELSETFQYIKYYYPRTKVPHFISFLSGFAYQVIQGESYMGIGLDMFLGKDSKFYGAIVASVPMYQSRRFAPEYIVPRVAEVFTREELFRERDEDQTLISKMIYNGKILYFLDQILPANIPDSVKIGYNTEQLKWSQNFEGNIWAFFLEQDLLFQSDLQKIQTYITDGPFTPGLGDKTSSAPKLGVFIGWQIVKKYMKENPDITLQQLMSETDSQKILTQSKYKPKGSQ